MTEWVVPFKDPSVAELEKKLKAHSKYLKRCARTKRVVKTPKKYKPIGERERIQFKEPSPMLAFDIMQGFRG